MQYWWVSQNKTHKQEIANGFMWSPKLTKNGSSINSYESMKKIMPGDVIYSFYKGAINAIGIAQSRAKSQAKPQFGKVGDNWGLDGWLVDVSFELIERPLIPSDHMDTLNSLRPSKHSPIKPDGRGNEVYLCQIPDAMVAELNRLLDGQVDAVISKYSNTDIYDLGSLLDDDEEEKILEQEGIDETFKLQLIKARRGQGLFKQNVYKVESSCRVTGIKTKSHLIASHIKPWRNASNDEKLDGNNGLLLSPHIDHLFDRGYISFSDDGVMLVSAKTSNDILKAWAIDLNKNCGSLNIKQKLYMQFHRENIFKK